jgi:hypothetical protein
VDSGAERKGGFRTLPTHVELRVVVVEDTPLPFSNGPVRGVRRI